MSRIAERIISSDDYLNAFDALIAGLGMATILNTSQGGFGQDVSAKTGSVVFYNGTAYFPDLFVTLEMFGGGTSASAATNTTAFDSAVATGKPIFIPRGSYNLNAVTKLTSPRVIFGTGRDSKLIFNTTGVGIEIEDATPDQGQTFYVHDLAFGNLTNVPASYILNRYPVNSRFERLYFSVCAATYCIDNESGYGTKIADCVFSDVTGSGVRFRQNADYSDYSFAASVQDCDFTRLSVHGIDIEGSGSLNIIGGVIESCDKGIYINPVLAQGQAWGINIIGMHFEANTTYDIDMNTSVAYRANVTIQGVNIPSGSKINLGTYGKLVVIHSNSGGPAWCTVSGSVESRVILLNTVEHNFVQSGTFQWYDIGQAYDASTSPTWYSSGSTNSVGTEGTLTGRWTRNGTLVTYSIALTIGATPTINAGVFQFKDSLLTLLPALAYKEAAGSALLYDLDTGNILPATAYLADATTVMLAGITGNGAITNAVPWTWAEGDQIRLTITYRGTAS